MLLLAFDAEAPVGCVALRALEAPNIGEMKRLFVRPEARGRGVGAALVRALVERAREAGYAAVRLDTLPSMRAAQALYRQLGFQPIAPYSSSIPFFRRAVLSTCLTSFSLPPI